MRIRLPSCHFKIEAKTDSNIDATARNQKRNFNTFLALSRVFGIKWRRSSKLSLCPRMCNGQVEFTQNITDPPERRTSDLVGVSFVGTDISTFYTSAPAAPTVHAEEVERRQRSAAPAPAPPLSRYGREGWSVVLWGLPQSRVFRRILPRLATNAAVAAAVAAAYLFFPNLPILGSHAHEVTPPRPPAPHTR